MLVRKFLAFGVELGAVVVYMEKVAGMRSHFHPLLIFLSPRGFEPF
jgi:hypothetical protein